ncbi:MULTISPECIES: GNAT family N-acetyltransferase [Rhodopseudomonas]|uniref:GCN5 family acetyltransferase n=1 Tax=Rhodopseudomonas palustris TaxID=1076 RepID=A0A0D7EUU6_RHOPL|nr:MULTISPECIES: GNAT family N-acetyltransferase [Rhodopseudomonas]KIZ44421.1 GCN5 family acetyltransferase [Rhodopseudomonas palustris]MDF3809627.1 GNAT family N-acetyltransferase [Rhodopseudomonas sp. BAL398]WOK17161.1 GNAT family N-acetyltransferase [Rhodopseudomonas sp. BAL398]
MNAPFRLRAYRADDEPAAVALWQRTWQLTYPDIDFTARLEWWRKRWHGELVPNAVIIVAERNGALIGFVTIDAEGYLDQIVVAPEHWGIGIADALVAEAKRLSPDRVTLKVNADNARAIRFYKRQGFVETGDEVNSSGRAVLNMEWQA